MENGFEEIKPVVELRKTYTFKFDQLTLNCIYDDLKKLPYEKQRGYSQNFMKYLESIGFKRLA